MIKVTIAAILTGLGLVALVFIMSGCNIALLPILFKAVAIEVLFVWVIFGMVSLFSVPSKSLTDQVKEYKKEVEALDKYVEKLKEN